MLITRKVNTSPQSKSMIQPITQEGVDTNGNWKRSPEGKRVSRKADSVCGWWDNITTEPVYIRDKHHLKKVCSKYNVIPRMFAKQKSQGKGLEWTF